MAATSLYFGNAVATVWLHADHVRVRYHAGARDFDDFRAFLHHLLRALARHGGGRALVDQRAMAAFTPPEQTYLLAEWLPQAVAEAGYRRGAVLPSQDVFARLAAATVISQVNGQQMTYQYFEDEAAALAWLLKR